MDDKQTKEYIVNNLNLGKLSPDEQERVIEKLGKEVEDKSFSAILGILDENTKKELLARSEKVSSTELHNFIKERVPNVKEIIEGTAKKVMEDFKKNNL